MINLNTLYEMCGSPYHMDYVIKAADAKKTFCQWVSFHQISHQSIVRASNFKGIVAVIITVLCSQEEHNIHFVFLPLLVVFQATLIRGPLTLRRAT